MTSRFDCFFTVLALLYVVGSSHAIYDPKSTTVKPPQHRERVLPWYLSESTDDLSRSPKWQTDRDSPRKPVIVNSGVKSWSAWRKNPGSEIEQRTEISDDRPPEINVDQDSNRGTEYEQFEQRGTAGFPTDSPGLSRNEDRTGDIVATENGKKKKAHSDAENELYEGIPPDSTKPHKDKLIVSSRAKLTVARYEGQSVQCPEADSSGQFVYPPDCKFFVNCWKGRAFVQPCAPGTLFNPETLECDFPHKVKCYGGELADFQSGHDLDSHGRREPLLFIPNQRGKLQVLKCPEHVTGLLPHPADCTKFLQCANGGTNVMDCGPGTVFNPALTVCDWPRNVRGCEDVLKPAGESGDRLVPPASYDRNHDHQRFAYSTPPAIKKVACPPDYTGLLPHPDTCKKFLQCANGITYVMDCGPGTAFNPLTSVCDWPYNVPGCKEDKPVLTQAAPTIATTVPPWPSRGSTGREYWLHRHNHTSPSHPIPGHWTPGQNNRQVTTTPTPPTDANARWRPTWKPPSQPIYWTTPTPPYPGGSPGHDHSSHYTPGNDRYNDHGQVVPPAEDFNPRPSGHRYDHSGSWSPDYETGSHPQYPQHPQNPQHSQHPQHPQHPQNHHHYHHNHYDPTRPDYSPDPSHGSGHPTPPYGHAYPNRPNEEKQETGGTWQPYPHHTPQDHQGAPQYNPWNLPNGPVAGRPDDSDRQRPDWPYEQTDVQRPNYNATGLGRESYPANRRVGQEFPPSRQDHGRISPEFFPPGNTRVDRINQTHWARPEGPGNQGFVPSSWSQEGQGEPPTQSQTRQWNQGTVSQEDKLREWESGNVHQQSTVDREADAKFDQWASGTNIFQHAKGQVRPGTKNTSKNSTASSYPNGIYVNLNGTRGHFITKEIEVNQGHSKTKTYRPNELQRPSDSNKTYDTSDDHRLNPAFTASSTRNVTNINYARPITFLHPSYYRSFNRSYIPLVNFTGLENSYARGIGFVPRLNHSTKLFGHSADLQGAATSYPLLSFTNNYPSNKDFFDRFNITHFMESGANHSTTFNHRINHSWNNLTTLYDYLFRIFSAPGYAYPNAFVNKTYSSRHPFGPFYNNNQPTRQRWHGFSNYTHGNSAFNHLQSPFYQYLNRSLGFYDFVNLAGAENDDAIASSATNPEPSYHQPPNHFLAFPSSTKHSEADGRYPAVPTSNQRPPYYRPSSHSLIFPDYTRTPTVESQYPAVPSTELQPPHYEPSGQPQIPLNSTRTPRVDSQFSIVPSIELQPPFYEPSNPSPSSPNFTRSPNVDSQFSMVPSIELQPPYYEPSNPSPSSPDFTRRPNVDSQFSIVPSIELQPPYYEPSNTSPSSPNFMKPPNVGSQFSVVPSIELQPPHYDPPNPPASSPNFAKPPNVGSQFSVVPSIELQPPYYEPSKPSSKNSTGFPNNEYPSVPINFHPSYYQPPSRTFSPPSSTGSPSVNSHYPASPATNLQPPHHEQPETPFFSSTKPSNVDTTYPSLQTADPNRPVVPPSSPSSERLDLKPAYHRPTESTTDRSPSTDLSGAENDRSFTILTTTTEKIPDKQFVLFNKKRNNGTTSKPSIGKKDGPSRTKFADVIEPDLDYGVDVLDDKEIWKPVLVFENKTRTTTTESSVVMRINKKKTDVDLFNIEEAPYHEEEPPFPAYYVPPVQPLNHSKTSSLITPISGQVIRLRGGSSPYDGYVEVQGTNPGWGVVCDTRNSWTLKEAHVVCRQLGYARGAEMAWQGRNTRHGVPSWIAANSVTCTGNETRFQSCKFTHEQRCRVERDGIGVRCVPNRVAHCRNDEIPYEGQCYHLADPDSGLNHAEALQYCSQRQSRLIDVTSQPENDFVSEWLLHEHPEVGSVMTSGVGFTALDRTLWLWEDSSRAKFKFAKWWPGWMEDKKQPPWVGTRPVCVVMKRKFPCHERPDSICVTDYFFWDTEDCATSTKGHSYICKRPYDDIGCIYGKGNQYAGNANVTVSGKPCLPWADEKVAHPLRVNVVNREIIEKLKLHNYCRNPNPNKESRPWCFTGAFGEREHCDIPSCGNIGSKKSLLTGQCKPKHFECQPGECIPSPWVCDGDEDCTNGADERTCTAHLNLFQKTARHKLEGYDVEKWLNTPLKTCALRCKEADFTCRSFAHKAAGNICLLSDSNVGLTGALKPNKEFDYYEMKERSLNCDDMYVCGNRKCVNQTQVCNGRNDCNDRTDESICTVENLDYAIRLAGSNNSHEGRIEVKVLGIWGQVCDDGFGMIDADVVCKELGFSLGILEIRPGGFYGNLDPPTRFMVDQLKCRGNETSLRECDFDGWGVHNCQPEEAVGVVCKTAVDSCQEGRWKCDNAPVCIATPFICDEVVDCPDGSDESPEHCDAPFEIRLANGSSPLEGRVEVRHHGVWGTVCDDDFSNATAKVICRSLGYGGLAVSKKDGFFGPGKGPVWLDDVFCLGNESQLYRCEHNHWGQHNCDHNEDAGVICTPGDVNDSELFWETVPEVPEVSINDLLPADCGKRAKDFDEDEDLIFAKVVRGSVAPRGTYPWQASIRVRGHSRSSHWCGAVIISPLHVLTAAHCLRGYNKGTYFVRAGDYNTEIDEGTEVEANIQDYYIHEDFGKGHRMNNDVALVLLKGHGIPLGRDIMPICLPPENTEYNAGLNCTISGFGSIETGKSTHSKDLRYGWVPLLEQSVCRADYIYGSGAISDGMVCAGYLDEGVDTCDGDSGGPLACHRNGAFTLYGITSWGQHCGRANKPGVYVRVSYYRRWIDQKIKESLGAR